MAFQKNAVLYFTLGASVLSLGACGFAHPNAMPSGYTHHHQTYKSPTPRRATAASNATAKVAVERRQYMDATQAQQFRDGIYNLLERLTMRAGMPPKPVYVLSPDTMTSFYANLDNDLRASLRHIGYDLSNTPSGAYVFTYDARAITPVSEMANNVELVLRVFTGLGGQAKQLTEEKGQFYVQGAEKLNITPARYVGLTNVVARPPQVQNVMPMMSNSVPTQLPPLERQPIQAPPLSVPAPVAAEVIPPRAPVATMPSASRQPVSMPTSFDDSAIPKLNTRSNVSSVSVPNASQARSVASAPAVEMPKMESSFGSQKTAVVQPPRMPALELPKPEVAIEAPQYSVSLNNNTVVAREPSRDDIVIINRGDAPPISIEIPEPSDVTALPGAAIEQPAKDIIRGRVSNPADF